MISSWTTETTADSNPISFKVVYSNPMEVKNEMVNYVVEQEDKDGKKERKTLSVSVSVSSIAPVLTESEQEQLAKKAAELLGYKFLGKG